MTYPPTPTPFAFSNKYTILVCRVSLWDVGSAAPSNRDQWKHNYALLNNLKGEYDWGQHYTIIVRTKNNFSTHSCRLEMKQKCSKGANKSKFISNKVQSMDNCGADKRAVQVGAVHVHGQHAAPGGTRAGALAAAELGAAEACYGPFVS